MPFLRSYETPQPAPDSERTPEVIEAEMKALELAMDALILLTLKLVCAVNFILYEQLSFPFDLFCRSVKDVTSITIYIVEI